MNYQFVSEHRELPTPWIKMGAYHWEQKKNWNEAKFVHGCESKKVFWTISISLQPRSFAARFSFFLKK